MSSQTSSSPDTSANSAPSTAGTTAVSGAPAAVTGSSSAPASQVGATLKNAPKASLIDLLENKEKDFKQFLTDIKGDGSRELSLAVTKIEEAVMWAKKHIG